MRQLTHIYSMDSDQPSWLIVSEWENVLSETLNIPIKKETRFSRYLKFNILDKYGLSALLNRFVVKKDYYLRFIMKAETKPTAFINKNVIPIIIDFWLDKKELPSFYNAYKEVPLILLTNLEVYEFLKQNNCPIKISHWPLSYPDNRFMDRKKMDKKYDFCIFGRPNPFFTDFLKRYERKHPDFIYILNKGDINNRQYVTNKGEFVAKDEGRQSYLDMIAQTKISCYSTPGIDHAKTESNSFNQVTPRLFELLSNGCHVIGHYPKAADTDWYHLSEIVPNVNTYQEFELVMDTFRVSEADTEKLDIFMKQHLTSTRSLMLESILKSNGIILKGRER